MKRDNLKIISQNVRGIIDFKKRRSIFQYIRRQKTNIAFLQETHSSKETENRWKNEWGGKIYFSHGTNHSRGNAILIDKKLNHDFLDEVKDASGRIQMIKLQIPNIWTKMIN